MGYLISLHDNEVDWNLLGIKVIGHIDALPIPEGTYEYGDAYMVGTETPYDMYIYTRPDGNVHTEGYWFPIGKFPMPGPKGPKGDGVETLTMINAGRATSATYDIINGIDTNFDATIEYIDSSTGEQKNQTVSLFANTPILPGKYISIGNANSNSIEVGVDDTALALDYIKIDKARKGAVAEINDGAVSWLPTSKNATSYSLVQRDVDGNANFNKIILSSNGFTIGGNNFDQTVMVYGLKNDLNIIDQNGGTLTSNEAYVISNTAVCRLKIQDKVYYRVSELGRKPAIFMSCDNTGTIYTLTCDTTNKTYTIASTLASKATHNLTMTNSATGTNIYFSLTNNRTETYEGAPAGLWSALENSPIACTVNLGGVYSSGMITTEGDNFKVFYGNSEEMTITQTEMAITDNLA